MRKIGREKIKRVLLLLMPWPLASPAIINRVVTMLNCMNSKFTTLYYIVNTIGRKGIGMNDIDWIRIILFADRVNVSVLYSHLFVNVGQIAHRGKTTTSFFSNMTLQKYFWITSDIFPTPEYLISVLKGTVSCQNTYQSGLAELTPTFM